VILWPEQASTVAPEVDTLVFVLLGVSTLLAGGVAAAILYFCVKYREGSRADRTPPPKWMQNAVETAWIAGPTLLGLFLFVWGARVFERERRPPPDALEIRVVGKQWMWHIQHPEGRREINELHIPVGKPVRLAMVSQDVIHDFFVPEFRVKQDVLPDRVTMVWFEASKPGVYQLVCSQFCGTAHAHMRGRVVALPPAEYARWLAGGEDEPPLSAAGRGARLFERYSCAACHLRAGGKGPPLMRVYGRAVRLSDDSVALADDTYLRQSILDPGAKLVYGYPNIMPGFRGRLSEEDLQDLLEYLQDIGRGREVGP
jgi:cytochrome c oxidase subunit 2